MEQKPTEKNKWRSEWWTFKVVILCEDESQLMDFCIKMFFITKNFHFNDPKFMTRGYILTIFRVLEGLIIAFKAEYFSFSCDEQLK